MNFENARERMVEKQIISRGIHAPEVLAAMLTVPRHLFVGESFRDSAYEDHPIPIGEGQTISQPYRPKGSVAAVWCGLWLEVPQIGSS